MPHDNAKISSLFISMIKISKSLGANNLIPMEIALKIANKIRARSPDEKRTSEDAVESPYIGTIQSKGITQLLLLGALDIIQKKYWRKLRDHVSDIHVVDRIVLLRALTLLEKLQQGIHEGDRTILLRALRLLENKGKLAIINGTSARSRKLCNPRFTLTLTRSFEEIKTRNGRICNTFKEACSTYGLINDDKEWTQAILEASLWASGAHLRDLLVTILLFCELNSPLQLWEKMGGCVSVVMKHIG
ncbi:hypothetical protein Tco_0099328 [Tanacetum coccineum]